MSQPVTTGGQFGGWPSFFLAGIPATVGAPGCLAAGDHKPSGRLRSRHHLPGGGPGYARRPLTAATPKWAADLTVGLGPGSPGRSADLRVTGLLVQPPRSSSERPVPGVTAGGPPPPLPVPPHRRCGGTRCGRRNGLHPAGAAATLVTNSRPLPRRVVTTISWLPSGGARWPLRCGSEAPSPGWSTGSPDRRQPGDW
jgi:hypothetical protein